MTLFGIEERPKYNDSIREQLAREYAKLLYDWCDDKKYYTLESCYEDCFEIFRNKSISNGYELAKEFEDKGYNPDADFVEIFDDVDYTIHHLVSQATKNWVIENDIKLDRELNSNVMVKYRNKKVQGIIVGKDIDVAKYLVVIPSEGMTIGGNSKAIINFEDVEDILLSA